MLKFEDIITGKISPTPQEKIEAVAAWLKKEYVIEGVPSEILLAMLAVHAHGDQKHFGHPIVSSSFGRAVFQIVFATGRWHLTFQKEPSNQPILLHPKSEAGSWASMQNRRSVGAAGAVIRTGKVESDATADSPPASTNPVAFVDGDNVQIHIPEVSNEDDSPSFSGGDIYNGLNEIGAEGRKSISIDLGSITNLK